MDKLLASYKHEFVIELETEVKKLASIAKPVGEAMAYSLMSGGKRIRPILAYLGADIMGCEHAKVRDIALAAEMIHIYSLVHDDLEIMDNDELRHGIAATHVKYGEAMAVLCGDGLLTLAFETLARDLSCPNKQKAVAYIARMVGGHGMVGGQSIDIANEGNEIGLELIYELNAKKTSALFKASLVGSAMSCGADTHQISILERYCENLGMIFQLVDDILDVTSTTEVLGKNIGKDVDAKKSTFLAYKGIKATRDEINRLNNDAIEAISEFGERAINLVKLSNYLVNRQY